MLVSEDTGEGIALEPKGTEVIKAGRVDDPVWMRCPKGRKYDEINSIPDVGSRSQ